MSEPFELTACEALNLIRRRELGAVELVDSCICRVEALEPKISAWKFLAADSARDRAKALDNMEPAGAMHGIPLGVKDVIETADMPTGYGSPIYEGWRPRTDAACVAIAKRQGGIVLGKTITTELACGSAVRTSNPLNINHTSGGSSAGSCAAVAAKMIPVAFGTQSGSSTIRPASYCGLVGMRPSMGLISVAGFKCFNGSFDTIGLLGRTVDDVELLWTSQLETSFTAGEVAPAPPKFLICYPAWMEDCEPAAKEAVDTAARTLAAAGARVEHIELPPEYAALIEMHQEIQWFETARSYAHEYETGRIDWRVRDSIERGMKVPLDRYVSQMKRAQLMRAEFPSLIGDADAILCNAAAGEALKNWRLLGDDFTMGDALQSRAWTLLHLPTVTLPAFIGPQGLPVGVQFLSAFGEDRRLLSAARWAESILAPTLQLYQTAHKDRIGA